LLDWRFKETELKKLRCRRRRLFGKELLMSFSNAQQSLFFIYLFGFGFGFGRDAGKERVIDWRQNLKS